MEECAYSSAHTRGFNFTNSETGNVRKKRNPICYVVYLSMCALCLEVHVDRGSGCVALCTAPCFLPNSHEREVGIENTRMLHTHKSRVTHRPLLSHIIFGKLTNETCLVELKHRIYSIANGQVRPLGGQHQAASA